MVTRRSILGVLIGAPIAKALPIPAQLPKVQIWPQNPESFGTPGVHMFWECPDPTEMILGLQAFEGHLFAFTSRRIYEVIPALNTFQVIKDRENSRIGEQPDMGELPNYYSRYYGRH